MFQDFEPFWEFVSGPIHAGTFGPNALDNTFGPQLAYHQGADQGAGPEPVAGAGMQFFGLSAIDGAPKS